MDDVHYLALAYILGLILFLAYLYVLDRYQKHLHTEISHLEDVVKRVRTRQEPVAVGPSARAGVAGPGTDQD